MSALTLHLPLVLVMVMAITWLFLIAAWKPQWLRQAAPRRMLFSGVEGVICGLVWALCAPYIESLLGFTGLMSGAVAGLSWGAVSFYGKTRLRGDLTAEDKQRTDRIFRR